MERTVSLRIPLIFSLIIHIMTGLSLMLIPAAKNDIARPSIIRIISPSEFEDLPPKALKRQQDTLSGTGRVIQKREGKPLLNAKKDTGSSEAQKKEEPVQRTFEKLPDVSSGLQPAAVPDVLGSTNDKEAENSSGQKDSLSRKDIQNPPAPFPSVQPPTIREKLFDRDIVNKFAKRAAKEEKNNSITFDTGEFRHRTYMLRLKEKIEGIWIYPNAAASNGIYGDLKIRFIISKNGSLMGAEVIRTSGHRILDDAALQALRDAQPFWPLPDEWGREALTIDGHFIYSIYGTYIR